MSFVVPAPRHAVFEVARDLRTWMVWSHVGSDASPEAAKSGTWSVDGPAAGREARLVWRVGNRHGSVEVVGEGEGVLDLVEIDPYVDLQGEGRRLRFESVAGGTKVSWEPLASWVRCPDCVIEQGGAPEGAAFLGREPAVYADSLQRLATYVSSGAFEGLGPHVLPTGEPRPPERLASGRVLPGEPWSPGEQEPVLWGEFGVAVTSAGGLGKACRAARRHRLDFLGVTGVPTAACKDLLVIAGDRSEHEGGAWARFGRSERPLAIAQSPADGLTAGPGASWDELAGGLPPEVPAALEIMGPRGSSEEYRAWRGVKVVGGRRTCPPPSEQYVPCCQQAAELVRRMCHHPESEACLEEMYLGRLAYLDGGAFGWLRASRDRGDTPEEWGECGECTDCWRPVFKLRPRRSVQYALATWGTKRPPALVGGGWLAAEKAKGGWPEPARDGAEDTRQLEWARASRHVGGGLTAVRAERTGAAVIDAVRAGRSWVTTGPRVEIGLVSKGEQLHVTFDGPRPEELALVRVLEGEIADPWAVVGCPEGAGCQARVDIGSTGGDGGPEQGRRAGAVWYARATWTAGEEEHRAWSRVVGTDR